jgi:hypothetical protein
MVSMVRPMVRPVGCPGATNRLAVWVRRKKMQPAMHKLQSGAPQKDCHWSRLWFLVVW